VTLKHICTLGVNSDIAQKIAISALQGSDGAAKLPYQESRRTSPCSYRCGPQDSASFTEPLEQPVPNGSCQQIQRCAKNNAPYLGRQMIQYVVLPVSSLHGPPQTAVHLRGPAEQPVVSSACQQSPGVAKNKPPYLKQPRNSVPGATCQQSCGPSQECFQGGTIPNRCQQTSPSVAVRRLIEIWALGLSKRSLE
jgi:hypothetical protein